MSILDIGADRVAKGSGPAARRALTCKRAVVAECWVLVDVFVGGLVYSHISHFYSENIRLNVCTKLLLCLFVNQVYNYCCVDVYKASL